MKEEKKEVKITFRVSSDEMERIEKKIEKSKLSRSEYLRKATLDKKIVVVEVLTEYSTELRRIGNNINQLTKAVNTGFVEDTGGKLDEIQKELREIWQQLREVHRGEGV